MPIRDLMKHGVEVIGPDDLLTQAAAKMAEKNIGFLPVCDGERLVGALTDRGVAVRATAAGLDPTTTAVREVMTEELIYCFEDEDIERTAQLMKQQQVRRVLIVDRNKKLVGVVTLGDLVTQQEGQAVDVLERVSEVPPTK